jgi:hypothetical protein
MSSTTPAGTFILWEKPKRGRPWSSGVKLLRIFILSKDLLLNHLGLSACALVNLQDFRGDFDQLQRIRTGEKNV